MESNNAINPTTPPNTTMGMPPDALPTDVEPKIKKTNWIALALLLLLAGLVWSGYIYYEADDVGAGMPPHRPKGAKSESDNATMMLGKQGTSDGVSAIEQDLNATDLNGLDKELSDINAQL